MASHERSCWSTARPAPGASSADCHCDVLPWQPYDAAALAASGGDENSKRVAAWLPAFALDVDRTVYCLVEHANYAGATAVVASNGIVVVEEVPLVLEALDGDGGVGGVDIELQTLDNYFSVCLGCPCVEGGGRG